MLIHKMIYTRSQGVTIFAGELPCPKCGRYHVDREEWYWHPHHTHLCEHCGELFRLELYARGIEPVSLRGRLTALKHALADWLYRRLS